MEVTGLQLRCTGKPSRVLTGRKKLAITAEYMHLAQLQEVEEDIYAVSFLKRQANGSYV